MLKLKLIALLAIYAGAEVCLKTALVGVAYSVIQLVDGGHARNPESAEVLNSSNGLLCPLDVGALFFTGIDMGEVFVTVDAHTAEPPLNLEGWEEAVEVSVNAPEGRLGIEPVLADAPGLPDLTRAGPGWYRVRCYARGRTRDLKKSSPNRLPKSICCRHGRPRLLNRPSIDC